MHQTIKLDNIYVPSPDIVARNIEDELIIIPIVSGIGNLEDELYSLNETGRDIWEKLSENKPLRSIIHELSAEYDCTEEKLIEDVTGLIQELVDRKILTQHAGQ